MTRTCAAQSDPSPSRPVSRRYSRNERSPRARAPRRVGQDQAGHRHGEHRCERARRQLVGELGVDPPRLGAEVREDLGTWSRTAGSSSVAANDSAKSPDQLSQR